MKNIILLAVLAAGLVAARAQESLPREELLKVAFMVSLDLKQMLNTPIPTDPDVKRPVAVRAGDRGAMVLPETKLSAERLAKAGQEVLPVGQLWLRKLTLQCDGQAAKPEKLRTVNVGVGDQTETVVLCALGVRKAPAGQLELLVYGREKEPLLQTPLKGIAVAQQNPIEISAALQGESAVVTLRLVGKYEASFMLVPD